MNNMNVIYKFDDSVTSDLFSIEPFVKGAVSELEGFIDDRDAIFDIKLILNELVVNGAMHGNCKDCAKKVRLKMVMDKKSLMIIVKDEGEGIDYESLRDDCKSWDFNGRGLFIVEALTDELILHDNEVIAIKNL